MKTRKYRGSERKLDKIESHKKHFGWATDIRDDELLIMKFDKKQKHSKALRRLEKQAEIVNSKLPKRMFVWTILAAIFLFLYFMLKDGILFGSINLYEVFSFMGENLSWLSNTIVNILPVLLIVIGGINALFAAYEFLTFIILKFTRRKTIEEIYRVADAWSGFIVDAPLKGNVYPNGPNTGVLAKVNIGSNYRK